MAVNVPPELDGLFYLVVGQPFPRLDVAGARAFAARLRDVGTRLEDLLQDGDAAGVAVGGALGGAAGDGVRRFVGKLTKLGPSMGAVARRNEEALRELALSEEKNGYEMLQELVLFFPQIMWALWSPWGAPWLPVLTAALRARLLPRLAKMESFALVAGRAMISEAASEVMQNANAQVLQFIERNRTSWDSMDSIVSAAAGGAAGGIMTAGMKAGQRYLGKHADTVTFHGGLEGATEVVVDAGATGILGGDFDGLGTAFTSGAFSGGAQKAADDTGQVIAGKMNQPTGGNTPVDPTTATGSGFANPALRKPGGAAAGTEGPRVERSGATKSGSEEPRIESPDGEARGGETPGSDMSIALPFTSSGSKTSVPNSLATTAQIDDSSTEPETRDAITTLPVVPISAPATPRVPQTWGKTESPVVSSATSRSMPQHDDVATISGGAPPADQPARPIVPSPVSNPVSTVAEPEDTTFRATAPSVQIPGEPQQELRFASSPTVDEDAPGNLNHQLPETKVPGPSGPQQLGDGPAFSGLRDEHAPGESAPIDQNAPTANPVSPQESPAAGQPDVETVGSPLRAADLPSQNPMTRDLLGNNTAADEPVVVVPGQQGPGGGLSGTPATPQAGTGLPGQPATVVSPGLGAQPPNSAGQQPSGASPAGQSQSGRGETAGGSAMQRLPGVPAPGFPVVPVSLRQGLDSVSAPAAFESAAQPPQQKAPPYAEQSADIHGGVPLPDRLPLTRASELPSESALGHVPADENMSGGIVPNSGDQPVGRGSDLPELALGSGIVPHGYSRERLGNAPAHQRGRAHEIRESAGAAESSVMRPAFEIRRAGHGSHGVVELTVRINFEAASGVDDTTRHRAVRDAQRAVDELRNKPNVRLSTGELLRFRIVPVEAGDRAHHTVVLDHHHKIDQNHWRPSQVGSRTAREIDHMLGILNGDPLVDVDDAGETAERMLPVDLAQGRLSPMAPPAADGLTEPKAQNQNTDDVSGHSDVVSIDLSQPAAELVHVRAHRPRSRAASGGLSLSSVVRNDALYWDQLYSAVPPQDTQPACFYVFVSATDGGFLVEHSLLDGAALAEVVLSSPHYQKYGADPSIPLRVVGIEAENSAEFHEQVAEFATALRGDGPFRTVEATTGELRVDETGQVVPLGGDYFVVSEFAPSEVSWTSFAGVDGHAFGAGLVLGEDRAAAFKRALGTYGPDRVMSLIGRKRQQGSDNRTVVRELPPWAHGVLGDRVPPVGFVLVMRDGKYLVPLEGGRLAAVSPRRMARLIVESPMYQEARNRPVRGDLVLFVSDDGADPAESGQAGAELRAALREWDEDSWHGYDYAGEIEFDERGLVVPEGAMFAESSPLPAQELDRVLSDSVFGFPVTDEDRKSLRELVGQVEHGAGQQPPTGPGQKKPLLVAVHSLDGKVVRVRSSSGVTHELGWRQFGRTLLSDSAFRLALERHPDRPVQLLFVGAGKGTSSSLAVSEMVGSLHGEGFLNDVYAPATASGWELVSGSRAGDLKWDVLYNRLGRPVAVYVRSDRDEERYSRAKEWAWNATPATLKSYEDGHRAEDSPWSSTELPLFLLFETGAEGVRGLRRGLGDAASPGQAQATTFTLEQFTKAMRSEPEIRKLLPRSGNRSLVLVPSGDSAVDGRTFTDVFSQGGYRRRVHLLTSGEFTQDGRLTAHEGEILTFEPPVLKPDDVFSRALVDRELGNVGQFFPLDDGDIVSMSGEARAFAPVRQMYFMREVSPATTDEQGAVVPACFAPFLASWAVEDKVAWTNSGHGGVDGFKFGTRTDSPWIIGDTVTLSGEQAARIMYGSSVYTQTRPDPARPNVLVFCSVNEVADGASESEARKLGRQWRKEVSLETVTFASTQVVLTMSGQLHAVKAGGVLADVERSARDSAGPVPLSDLAAEQIAPVEIEGTGRKLTPSDAERVREIARKVARAAAWRRRNGAGLPEVGITTERAAAVFLDELAAEWARLGRFGRGLRPEDLAIRVGGPGRRRPATISVELPKNVPGAREVRDATGSLEEITTARFGALEAAFAKLVHDESAAVSASGEPVAPRHPDLDLDGDQAPGHEVGEWFAHSGGQASGDPWTGDGQSGSGGASPLAHQQAEQPFVNTHEPFGDEASGALSLDYGSKKDRAFWEQVYSASRRPGFTADGIPPPFYLFVTWSGGLAQVGDQAMGGAELAEFVRRSPHYQRYADDRSVVLRIIGVQVGDNDLAQITRTAREFAIAERGGQDSFRLVQLATRSVSVGTDNRVVGLDDSAYSIVSAVQADDLQWRSFVGRENEPLGLLFGHGSVAKMADKIGVIPSDLALRWTYERSLADKSRDYVVPAWAPATTGDRVRPVLVMLSLEGGLFEVPIPGQLITRVSPAFLVRAMVSSPAFRAYRKQAVRPQLIILGHDVSADTGPSWEALRELVRELRSQDGRPWQTHLFAGDFSFSREGFALPHGSQFEAGPPLSTDSIELVTSPSLFGFPLGGQDRTSMASLGMSVANGVLAGDEPWNLNQRTRGKRPIFVLVNSPDGAHALIESQTGPRYEVDGAELAVILWNSSEFSSALAGDPDRPLVVVSRDNGVLKDVESLGRQIAERLRQRDIGHFGDVYAAFSDSSKLEYFLVSDLLGTDLEIEFLPDGDGDLAALYLSSGEDGDSGAIAEVRSWAQEVTSASLSDYQVELSHGDLTSAGSRKISGWSTVRPPIFFFVSMRGEEFVVQRRDGEVLHLSAGELSGALTSIPALGKVLRRHQERPIVIASLSGDVSGGGKLAAELMRSGFSRTVFEARHGIKLLAGGRFTATLRTLVAHQPPAPRADQIDWSPFSGDQYGQWGHALDVRNFDKLSTTIQAPHDSPVRRQYYFRRFNDAVLDENDRVVIRRAVPYLSPQAVSDLPPYLWIGHGSDSDFALILKPNKAMERGDVVLSDGGGAARLLVVSDVYRMVKADPRAPVLFASCLVATGGDKSPAADFSRQWRLLRGGKPIIAAADDIVTSHSSSTRSVPRESAYFAFGDGQRDPEWDVPLLDLAATEIGPAEIGFGSRGELGIGCAEVLRMVGQKLARAAAWRALNGAEMPTVVIKGTGVAKGSSSFEATHAVLGAEMIAEWGRLGRLARGLTIDDVVFDLVDVPASASQGKSGVVITVDLPPQALGQDEVTALLFGPTDHPSSKELDALDKAFAKLAPSVDDAPPSGDIVSVEGKDPRAKIVEPPMAVHDPSEFASGGLSFDAGATDLGHAKRVARYAAMPPAAARPFYLFLTSSNEGLSVNGTRVLPAVLLEIVKRSPHYQKFGSAMPVRVVGVNPADAEVRQFARLLRGRKGGFRLIEAAPVGSTVFQRISEVRPEDVAWLPLSHADGRVLGMSFDTQARQADGTAANLRRASDESTRVVLERSVDENGSEHLRPKIALWADTTDGSRLRPFELLLDADGEKYVVPLISGEVLRVSPDEMAKLAYKSRWFRTAHGGTAQPDIVLITNDLGAGSTVEHPGSRKLQARLRELGGPRRITAYSGPADHDATVPSLRVPEGAEFEQTFSSSAATNFSLNANAVRKSVSPVTDTSSGSVFAFPVPGDELPGLRSFISDVRSGTSEWDGKPLFVIVDSPDGKYVRVALYGGRVLELGGADFGRMLLNHSGFWNELNSEPARPIVVVTPQSVTNANFGDVAYDLATVLHEEGIYREVYVPTKPSAFDEFTLVSGLRDGDLEAEVLFNASGYPVSLYFRSENDEADYDAASTWAFNATEEKLETYQVESADGARTGRRSSWQEMPLFLIARSGNGRYRVERSDGVMGMVTPEQFARVARAHPAMRQILGTNSLGRPIALVTPNGEAAGGHLVRDSLLQGGFRRPLSVATTGVRFEPDGTITVSRTAFTELPALDPSDLAVENVVTQPRRTSLSAVDGQYFPSGLTDSYLMSQTARSGSSRRGYYVRKELTAAARKNGTSETEYVAYLSPLAGIDGRPWVIDGHGSSEGFTVGLRTDRPWEIGDTTVIGGAIMAKMVTGGSLYREAGLPGDNPVLLLPCSINRSAVARDLMSGWQGGASAPSTVVGPTSDLLVHSGNGLQVTDSGGRITEVSPMDGDQTPLVALADLAATEIEPVTVTFSSVADTGPQEQKDLVGTIARRVARAAAWRGVNGAGPVLVEITGFGTLGALARGAKSGLDHANSAHSLFNEALHDEFAVLRKFGLDVALAQVDVQVLSAVATRDGGHTALIAVRLPERELGLRELRDLAGDVDTLTVTAVDKAFSRLSPESGDSVGEPSGEGTLVRRGPFGPVEHYGPVVGKAGGLGFDWDGFAITVRWARVYGSMPVSRNHTFDIFVTQQAGTFLVAGQYVDARTLARIVTASPHFTMHAADPSTAVRLVIAVDLTYQDQATYAAKQFALALRGVGPFRSVEVAPVSVQVDQDGQVSLLNFGSASVVSSPRSEDVAWIPLIDVAGITFGMAFDTPKNRNDDVEKHSGALPAAIQLGIVKQAVINASGVTKTESVVAPWASVSEADGVHTRTVLLLLESSVYGFMVPTKSKAVVDVAPDAMARLVYSSDIFTMFGKRQVLPTLLLVTANPDGDVPAGASAVQRAVALQKAAAAAKLNTDFLETLRFLSGQPWLSIDYVGRTSGEMGMRVVSSVKSFRMGPPPSLRDFLLVVDGSVAAFPSAAVPPDRMREVSAELARRASVNGASNQTPLQIVVDSPDGRVARLLTSSGAVVEMGGRQLGRMLLGHPEIQMALRHDPQRRWKVVGNRVGEKISHGGLAYDIAGAFRAAGHFGEIVATTGQLVFGRGSMASLDHARYEVVSKIRYGELAVDLIANGNGIDVLYVWSAGNRAGHQKAADWAKHATRHTLAMYEIHAADGRVEMRQAPWVRPPVVVFVDAGVNGYDILRLNGNSSAQKSTSMVISPDDLARGLSGYSMLTKPVDPIDGRDLLLVSPNGRIGDGQQVGKSLLSLGRHVTVHEAPLSPAWRADGTLATAGQPMVKHLRPTPSPADIIVHRVQRQHLPWTVTAVYSPARTDDVFNMSRSAHANNVVQQEYYFKTEATNLVDAAGKPLLRHRAFLSPWAGIDAPSWSLIGHGVPEGFAFRLKTDMPSEFGDGVYLDGAIAARVLFGTDSYRRAQLDPDRPVVLRTCHVNTLLPAGDTQAARFSAAVTNMRPQHAKFFAANAVVGYGPSIGYYTVAEPAFYGEAGESSVSAGDEVPLTDFVTSNIASAQVMLSVQGPQLTMPQSTVDVIRDMARQVARAALWRKLNNVGMPVMTVTAKNKRLTNLVTLALQNAMTVEWARRGRLGSGLSPQDVHVVETSYAVRSGQVEVVMIKVDLPQHDLGETELSIAEYVLTEESMAALNAKFARLAR